MSNTPIVIAETVSKLPQTNVQLLRQMSAAGYGSEDLIAVARAYTLGTRLFSGRYRACGKPFVCHLVGTAAILVWLRAPISSVICGLLHAAYQEGDFGNHADGMTRRKRDYVRSVIGETAEDLIAAYTLSSRTARALVERHAKFSQLTPLETTILLVQLANELEDYRETSVLYMRNADYRLNSIRLSAASQMEMAHLLGFPALAEAMRETYGASLATTIPPELRSSKDNGYTLIPASCRKRWPVMVRNGINRVLRKLNRTWGQLHSAVRPSISHSA